MKTFWLLYKSEAKLSIREMSSIIFGIFVPLGIVCLMGVMDSSNDSLNTAFVSVSTVGICSAGVMGLPLALSSYRERKILKRYQVTPISPIQLLLAHLLFCFTISIVSMLLLLGVLVVFFQFSYVGNWLYFIPAYLLVMISIHAIGLIVASLSPSEKATGAINSEIFFPMFFLSGATVPYEIMPQGLQKVADIMPLTQGIKLLKTVTFPEENGLLYMVLLLTAISIIGIFIAVRYFRWE
ncbi:ABC transporter permease [Enterococcus innesii]|uniref:ABC transporter permease n=1 Tax=Enterococcus innesii TaxID=2839759 RepID=UPI00232B6B6A|nr:ABC transporter permease [Enterococcus innesii]MDC0751420.1 ABC transporter permease [Enterococcus innesii]MDC0775507.1 ABC transporter permease [Enterococcus innesii]MDC0778430.1 ABC transporter permease [Enterococcus innesii]MDC0782268.1 ABC transporter permease [Enterococcus innesii]